MSYQFHCNILILYQCQCTVSYINDGTAFHCYTENNAISISMCAMSCGGNKFVSKRLLFYNRYQICLAIRQCFPSPYSIQNMQISHVQFDHQIELSLPKQSQKSRSVLLDGSRQTFGNLLSKGKPCVLLPKKYAKLF